MRTKSRGRTRFVAAFLAAALGFIVVIAAENVLVPAYVADRSRFVTDFSPAYLRYAVRRASDSGTTVFLGDSVLWGYRLEAHLAAPALLAADGLRCRNLAFKSGNPANSYLLSRLLLASPSRPARVVIEINSAVFNTTNDDYRNLHPAIARAAASELTQADRDRLTIPSETSPLPQGFDDALSGMSALYAMRSDLRESLFGDVPSVPLPQLTPDMFAGVYDLVPLNEENVGVHFLEATAQAWRAAHVPLVAFMTPTNHALLHDYIDNSLYAKNLAYVRRLLEARGARVIDLDRAVPGDEFFDNAHLTARGQKRLARLLGAALASR